jgi:hypothetical protein
MNGKPDCCDEGSLPVRYGEDALLRRTFVLPQPPRDFDPVAAPDEELASFGIIPRPDREKQPKLYADWLSLFGPSKGGNPPEFVAADLQEVLAPWQFNTRPSAVSASGTGVSRTQGSGNWSGAYIVPTDNTMVVLVGGEWTLPTLALPPPPRQVANANQYVCSTWVGLDGQRRYLNSSLPQIGVSQTLLLPPNTPPQISAQAFFQWWDRQQTCHTFIKILNLAVKPGDVVRGAVWAFSPTRVHAYLRNVTTGHLAAIGANAPVLRPAHYPPFQLTISGATAEWILERPSVVCSTDMFPFPKYTDTTFRCWAGVARSAGPAQFSRDLHRSRLIRMYDRLANPMRTESVSVPHRGGVDTVQIHYV